MKNIILFFVVVFGLLFVVGCQNPVNDSTEKIATTNDTPPSLSLLSVTNSDEVVIVYFNEEVDPISSQDPANYTFKTTEGVVLNSQTGGRGIDENGHPALYTPQQGSLEKNTNLKTVVIYFGMEQQSQNPIPAGKYQIYISGIKNLSGTAAIQAQTLVFTVTETIRPTLDGRITGSAHQITIKFSEPMDIVSTTSGDSYEILTGDDITGHSWTKLSDLNGISMSLSNLNKDLTITFPNSINIDNKTMFRIGTINNESKILTPKDVAGNLFGGGGFGSSTLTTSVKVD